MYLGVCGHDFHVLLILLIFIKHIPGTRPCAKHTPCFLSPRHLKLTEILRGSSYCNAMLKRKAQWRSEETAQGHTAHMYQSRGSTPKFSHRNGDNLMPQFFYVFSCIYFIRQVTPFIQLSQKTSSGFLISTGVHWKKQTYEASTFSYCRLIQTAQKTPGLSFNLFCSLGQVHSFLQINLATA